MTLDKLAPWELEKVLNAINVVRDLAQEYAEIAESDIEREIYENADVALKLLELEVRVARAKE